MDEIDDAGDCRRATERLARPGAAEVAPLRQVESRAAQPLDGAVSVRLARTHRAARPAQRPANTFGRILEIRLQPGVEGLPEQPLRLSFSEHAEQRIDARFNRPLAKQVGAEAVNRADVRFLELRNGALEPIDDDWIARLLPLLLEPLAQSQLQLARRFLGERDGDDLAHLRAPFADDREDAVDQFCGLARARCSGDEDRVVDRVADDAARVAVGAIDHGSHGRLRSASRSASLSCGLRATRRATSRPQTEMKSQRSHALSAGEAARKPSSMARSMMRSTSRPAVRVMSFNGISCG